MLKNSMIGVLLILAGNAAACAGSQSEQVRDARMEQADARAESEAQIANADGEARDRAIEQRHENVSEQLEATNPPDESAAQDMLAVSEERLQYQSDAKTKLDELGAELSAARSKLEVLGGKAPIVLKNELKTAAQQYDTLANDVKSLDKTPASTWESTTDQVDERMSSLESRIDELTDEIEDV